MKFNCGPTSEERREARRKKIRNRRAELKQWHQWFAWHPVRLNDGQCVWMEMVYRRGVWKKMYNYGFLEEFIGWEYQQLT